jgi:hypothetical protein
LLLKDTKTNNDTQLLPAQYKYEERKKTTQKQTHTHTHTHKERKKTNKQTNKRKKENKQTNKQKKERKKDEYPNVVLVGIKCQRSSSNKFASGLMREMGTKQTDGFW